MPKIDVLYVNPPKKGLIIKRKIGGGEYIRKVGPKDFVTTTEACAILKYSLVHLYRLVSWKKLKPVRKRGRLFFRLKDVLELKVKKNKGKKEAFLN
jgi:hypothetical protein